jgi:iron complex outermembrane receptor protein
MRQLVASVALLVAVGALPAFAQSTGRLKGTVVDENRKPIPGVQVVATRTGEGAATVPNVLTDTAGAFEFPALPPGTYTLTLSLSGLPDQQRPGVEIAAGRTASVAVELNLSKLLNVLEQVTVTARRVEEELQTTPVPVTAVTTQMIEANRLDTIDKFVEMVPNATMDESFGFEKLVTIRGVTSKPTVLAENAVGLFRNGQYYGGTIPNQSALVDLEQVEVMRGPQGGLYGRNAVGGAMNFIFGTPRNAVDESVNFRYGSFERADVDAMVNFPIVDERLMARVVGWRYGQEQGEHYNITLNQQMDKSHDEGGRVGLKWVPRSDLFVTWMYEKVATAGPSYEVFFPEQRPNPLAAYGFPPEPAETKETIRRNTPSSSDKTYDFLSQDIVWGSRVGEFTVAASYRKYNDTAMFDFDFTADQPDSYPGALDQVEHYTTDATTGFVETRYASTAKGPVKVLAGVSYYTENLGYNQVVDTTIDLSLLGFPFGLTSGTGNLPASLDTRSWSGYGEVKVAPSENVELTGSVRYTHDRKSINYQQYIESDNPIIPILFASSLPTLQFTADNAFTNWSPGASISVKANEAVNLYGRVNTGFRSGGFNVAASSTSLLPFNPETSINYEGGVKTEWLKRRVRVNLAAFRFDQHHLLLLIPDPVTPTFAQLRNGGTATTNGFELETEAALGGGLNVGFTLGLLDAKIAKGAIDQGFGLPLLDITGRRVLLSPRYNGDLRAFWERPLGRGLSAQAGANYRFRSNEQASYDPTPIMYDAYSLLDASLGLSAPHWQVSLFGENLTNDQGVLFGITSGGFLAVDTREGRIWGVKVGYRFR